LMVVVTVQLSIATLAIPTSPHLDILGGSIALISTILAMRFGISSIWLILGGAAIGPVAHALGYLQL
jgi:chromate transporter